MITKLNISLLVFGKFVFKFKNELAKIRAEIGIIALTKTIDLCSNHGDAGQKYLKLYPAIVKRPIPKAKTNAEYDR